MMKFSKADWALVLYFTAVGIALGFFAGYPLIIGIMSCAYTIFSILLTDLIDFVYGKLGRYIYERFGTRL